MPDADPDLDIQRIVKSLSDASALRRQGVDDLWIARCADLVNQWQQLERRFKELESRLSGTDEQGSQDTIVF